MIFCYECKWISKWGGCYHSLQDKYVLYGWRAGLEVVRLTIQRPLRAVIPWLALALALVGTYRVSYQWSAARVQVETYLLAGKE